MRPSFRSVALPLLATTLHFAPLFAQEEDAGPAFLRVCNKGTRAVSTATARWDMDLMSYRLVVSGWYKIAPGECSDIYDYQGTSMMPEPSYLAFALFDKKGGFVPARVTTVPDIGTWRHFSTYAALRFPEGNGPALTRAHRQLCVHEAAFEYEVHTKDAFSCEGFRASEGPWLPLEAQMFFHPSARECSPEMDKCWGGRYYLDVGPRIGGTDLAATWGTHPDEDSGTAGVAPTPGEMAQAADEAIKLGKDIADAIVQGKPIPVPGRRSEEGATPPPPAGPTQSVAGYRPSWIGKTMGVRGTVSRFLLKDVSGEQWIYLYFKERPDSTLVACCRDANWLLGVLGVDDFQSTVGKTLEFTGEVVSGTCAEKGAGLWIYQRNQARLLSGG